MEYRSKLIALAISVGVVLPGCHWAKEDERMYKAHTVYPVSGSTEERGLCNGTAQATSISNFTEGAASGSAGVMDSAFDPAVITPSPPNITPR